MKLVPLILSIETISNSSDISITHGLRVSMANLKLIDPIFFPINVIKREK